MDAEQGGAVRSLKGYMDGHVVGTPGYNVARASDFFTFLALTEAGRTLFPQPHPDQAADVDAPAVPKARVLQMSFCSIMLEAEVIPAADGAMVLFAPLEDELLVPSDNAAVAFVLRAFLVWWRAQAPVTRQAFLADVCVKTSFLQRPMLEQAICLMNMPAFTQPNDKSGKLATFVCLLHSQRPTRVELRDTFQALPVLRVIVDLIAKYFLVGVGLENDFWTSAFLSTRAHGAKDALIVVRVEPPAGQAVRAFVYDDVRYCDNGAGTFVFDKTWGQVEALFAAYGGLRFQLHVVKGFLRGELLPPWDEAHDFVRLFDIGAAKVAALALDGFYGNDKERLVWYLYYLLLMSDSGAIQLWGQDTTTCTGVVGNCLGSMRHLHYWAGPNRGFLPGREPMLGNGDAADALEAARIAELPPGLQVPELIMRGFACACGSFRCQELLTLVESPLLQLDAADAAREVGDQSLGEKMRYLAYRRLAKDKHFRGRTKFNACVSFAVRLWYPGGTLTGFLPPADDDGDGEDQGDAAGDAAQDMSDGELVEASDADDDELSDE